MARRLAVIGAPSGAGACGVATRVATALRERDRTVLVLGGDRFAASFAGALADSRSRETPV
jgi:adenylylsulfate kinase-like enzyme